MTEVVAAAEDVKMSEAPDVVPVSEVSKVASELEGDVAMGDGDSDDHEKMLKASKQSELRRFLYYC